MPGLPESAAAAVQVQETKKPPAPVLPTLAKVPDKGEFLFGTIGDCLVTFTAYGFMSFTMRMQSHVLAKVPFFRRFLPREISDEPRERLCDEEILISMDIAQFTDSIGISARKFIEESFAVIFDGDVEVDSSLDMKTRYSMIDFRDYIGLPFEGIIKTPLPKIIHGLTYIHRHEQNITYKLRQDDFTETDKHDGMPIMCSMPTLRDIPLWVPEIETGIKDILSRDDDSEKKLPSVEFALWRVRNARVSELHNRIFQILDYRDHEMNQDAWHPEQTHGEKSVLCAHILFYLTHLLVEAREKCDSDAKWRRLEWEFHEQGMAMWTGRPLTSQAIAQATSQHKQDLAHMKRAGADMPGAPRPKKPKRAA